MRVLYTHPDTGIVSCIEADNIEACTFDVEVSDDVLDTAAVIAVSRAGVPILVSPFTEEEIEDIDRLNEELGQRLANEVVDLRDRQFRFPAFCGLEEDDEDDEKYVDCDWPQDLLNYKPRDFFRGK